MHSVLQGGPADLQGIQTGDIFVTIDGAPVQELRTEEVAAKIMGPQGSSVPVRIKRGQENIDLDLIRDSLKPIERTAATHGLPAKYSDGNCCKEFQSSL